MPNRLAEAARLVRSTRRLTTAMALACAVLLTGCGASLNSESAGLGEAGEPKLGVGSSDKAPPNAPQVAGKAKVEPVSAKGKLEPASARTASLGTPEASRTSVSAAGPGNGFIAASAPGNTAYRIGAQDVVDISVFQVAELSKQAQVSDGGTINLPLIGEVSVVGRTAQEVERDLTKRLGAKYLQNPQVTVMVKEYNSQQITVDGSVKKPGVIPLRGKTSLMQAIALANGFDDKADDTAMVFRMTEKGRTGARFDVAEIRAGKAEDPMLQSGDVVVVGSSNMKEYFNAFTKLLPLMGIFALL